MQEHAMMAISASDGKGNHAPTCAPPALPSSPSAVFVAQESIRWHRRIRARRLMAKELARVSLLFFRSICVHEQKQMKLMKLNRKTHLI
jgi:hypothetical protein